MSHYPPRSHYGPDQVIYKTSSQDPREGCRVYHQAGAMQHQQFGWQPLMFLPWPGAPQHEQFRRPPLLPNPHQTSQNAVPSLMSLSLPSPPQSWPYAIPSHSHILQNRDDGAGGRKKQKSRQTVPNRNLRIVTTGDDRQQTALQKRAERFLNNNQPTMRPTILPEKARIPLPEKVHISMPWQGKADPEVLQEVLKSIQGCQQSDPPSASTKPDDSDDEILIVPVPPKLAPPVIELDSSLDSPQSPARSFKKGSIPELSLTVLSGSGLAGEFLPVKKELNPDGADRSAESNPTPSKTPSMAPQPTPAYAATDRSSKPNPPSLSKTSSTVPEPAPAHAAAEGSSSPASKSKTPLVAEPAPAHSNTTTTTPAVSQQVTNVPPTPRTHTVSTNKRRSDQTPPDSPTALKKRKLQSSSTVSPSSPVPPGDLRELLRKRQVERASSSAPASPLSDSLIPSAPGDLRMLEQHRKAVMCMSVAESMLVTSAADATLNIYDMATGRLLSSRDHPGGRPAVGIVCILSSYSRRAGVTIQGYLSQFSIITGDSNGAVRCLEAVKCKTLEKADLSYAVSCMVNDERGGNVLVGLVRGAIYLFRPRDGGCEKANFQAESEILCLVVSRWRGERVVLVAARNSSPVIRQLETGRLLLTLATDAYNSLDRSIKCCSLLNNRVYCCDFMGTLAVFNISDAITGRTSAVKPKDVFKLPAVSVCCSVDSRLKIVYVAGRDGRVRSYDAEANGFSEYTILAPMPNEPLSCMLLHEDKIVLANKSGQVAWQLVEFT